MVRDVFISYKKDNAGNNFANRLKTNLESMGYSVYFNADENGGDVFPEEIRLAIENCKDFILIISQQCLEQLKKNGKIDWVREEILIAREHGKHIVPILLDGVRMPKDKEEMPESLQFLPDINGLEMPDIYDVSPLDKLVGSFKSRPEKDDIYRDVSNSNPDFRIDKTVEELEKQAEESDEALYELACLYYYGFAGSGNTSGRNFQKAYYYLNKIIQKGIINGYKVKAYSLLAEMSYHGVLPRGSQSYEKAREFYGRSKDVSGFSYREYAYMTSRGCGCEFDYETTVNIYKEAADKGDTVAILGLANTYKLYGKFREAEKMYKKADSHPQALFELGKMYRNGVLNDPPMPDMEKAAFYFQRAIDTGRCSSEVYQEMGRLYFTPCGDFPKDFKTAEKYFLIAADMGDHNAQYKLGLMYEYGYTGEKNFEKAIYYHSLAAAQGATFSAYHLSMLYQEEGFVNYHKSYVYAKQAADRGVMEAEYILGMLLFWGRGCVADIDEAYKFFEKAYMHGLPQAKIMMDKIDSID